MKIISQNPNPGGVCPPIQEVDGAHAVVSCAANTAAWAAPMDARVVYTAGECVFWEGTGFRCKTDNAVHAPGALPRAWEEG